MPTYSPEFKEAVIARMLPPGSESMNRISRETGVCLTTLRKWKQRALGEAGLHERAEGRRPQAASLSRRFRIAAAGLGRRRSMPLPVRNGCGTWPKRWASAEHAAPPSAPSAWTTAACTRSLWLRH